MRPRRGTRLALAHALRLRRPVGTNGFGPAFVLHTVLTQLLAGVLRPSLAYRALELDVPTAALGAVAASFALAPLALALPSGQLVDRVGERIVMVAGALLMTASCVVAALAADVAAVVIASALLGTGHLLSVMAEQAWVANGADPARYDGAFGHYTFAVSIGQTVGPALLLLAGDATVPDTRPLFVGAAAGSALLLLASACVRATPRHVPSAEEAPARVRSLLRLPGLLRVLLVGAVVLTTVDITLVYLPALGAEREVAAGVMGALLAARACASTVSRFFVGQLSARLGRRRLLFMSLALSTAALALVPVPMSLPTLAIVMALLGLGLGVGQPLTMAWLAEATAPGARGRAMSLRLSANRLGQVLLPSALGLIAVSSGAGGVLWLSAGVLAAAGVAARNVRPPTPQTGP